MKYTHANLNENNILYDYWEHFGYIRHWEDESRILHLSLALAIENIYLNLFDHWMRCPAIFRWLVPIELSLVWKHVLVDELGQLFVHLLYSGRKRVQVDWQTTCKKKSFNFVKLLLHLILHSNREHDSINCDNCTQWTNLECSIASDSWCRQWKKIFETKHIPSSAIA